MRLSKQKVEIIMAKKAMTYTELAKAAGVSCGAITQYFNRDIRTTTAYNFAKALGVEVETIVK